MLAVAFGFAVTLVATKKLTRTDSTFAIIFWMMLIQLPLALITSDPLFLLKLEAAHPRGRRYRCVGPRIALLPDQTRSGPATRAWWSRSTSCAFR